MTRHNIVGRGLRVSHGRLEGAKAAFRAVLPLGIRKSLAAAVGRQRGITHRAWWVRELLRDFAASDPAAYHRFLWSNHLGYAETYEVDARFGTDELHPSRHLLFDELDSSLAELNMEPGSVASVFEVGCSLGFNLRFLERRTFQGANIIEGCDIDAYAVEQGEEHLRQSGSRIRLHRFDIGEIDTRLQGRAFDVVLCAGVLMYMRQHEAADAVAAILRHTGKLAAFAGLADPERDNSTLSESCVRSSDGTFVHNLDSMILRAGWRIVRRRWDGARQVGGNTIYFVFATPGIQ